MSIILLVKLLKRATTSCVPGVLWWLRAIVCFAAANTFSFFNLPSASLCRRLSNDVRAYTRAACERARCNVAVTTVKAAAVAATAFVIIITSCAQSRVQISDYTHIIHNALANADDNKKFYMSVF